MSVSTAIDSSHQADTYRSGTGGSATRTDERGIAARQDDGPQPEWLQTPALFRRPTAPVALRPAADTRRTDIAPARRSRAQQRPAVGTAGAAGGRPSGFSSAPPISQAAKDLLADAARGLGRAMEATSATDRYAAAHLAALRAAAAVLAARARPVRGRRGSAWELMSKVAPEFAEWAAFFAAGSAKRQAAQAGIGRLVAPREADDMVRQVAAFIDLVEDALTKAPRQRSGRS